MRFFPYKVMSVNKNAEILISYPGEAATSPDTFVHGIIICMLDIIRSLITKIQLSL